MTWAAVGGVARIIFRDGDRMKLRLQREILTAQSTIGRLFVDDVFMCWTLEDVDREITTDMPLSQITSTKVYGRTAIPRGSYRVVVDLSSKFNKLLPRLVDVPGFVGIRIHAGNHSMHTLGCILVGLSHGHNEIFNSKQAMNRVLPVLATAYNAGQRIDIDIVKVEPSAVAGLPPVPALAATSKVTIT